MNPLPSVERVAALFSRFPGVGRKSAQRMVHYLLRQGGDEIAVLIRALEEVRDRVRSCTRCFNLAEGELCAICQDSQRDGSQLCVVEEASDLLAIEKTGQYRGSYHVLGGRLSPLDGVGAEKLHMAALQVRLRQGGISELILATNPTVQGEATAHYVAQIAQPWVSRITRLASGVPMGGELEYLDESTLYHALSGRRSF